ncbi:MAG: glutaredoxin [Chlamydiae bacterium]|nr:glutaredoxin [Chlamydiota bacterium]
MKYIPLLSLFFLVHSPDCQAQSPSFAHEKKAKKYQLELYYTPWCPYCQKVTNYMNQAGISIPLKDIQSDPVAKETLLRQGGKTQVPCLFIDGRPMYESDQIISWLQKNRSSIAR